MAQIFPIDFEEKLTMAQDDYILFSDSEDGNKIKKAQYSNLKWEKWDTWTAATISVWTTTTWAAWTSASVTNVGTSGAAVFNFTIPKGDKWDTGQTWPAIVSAAFNGDDIDFTEEDGNVVTLSNAKVDLKGDKWDTWLAATISVWTTTTLDAWDNATVTNSWTSSAAVFNFGIPKWDTGDTWATGNWIASISSTKAWKTTTVTITETNGDDYSFQVQDWADGEWAWDVIWPASSTDGHLAVFDGNTWKLIKDGGVVPSPTTVVDSLDSTSTTSALSANQGKVLDGKISDLFGLWKFLSLWDATTWLPISFPLETPYTYTTWDYFLVETVSSATPPVNYRPTGSSYNWTASSTTESDELEAWDVYIYDGSVWLLQSNHWKTVAFSNIAWDAMDNANLSSYLNMKAFYLSSTSDLTTAQKAFEWQNGGKTAIVVYNSKPYAFSFYNTAEMAFACLFYREQLEAGNNKTSLVRDVITFSVTWGTTVSSISANSRNNVIASVLKTDTDYATPYTPQYDGSPATKKYVDDNAFAPWGTATTGYVVTKTASGYEWKAPTGWIQVDSASPIQLTKIWAGTEAHYQALWTYDNTTVYLTI